MPFACPMLACEGELVPQGALLDEVAGQHPPAPCASVTGSHLTGEQQGGPLLWLVVGPRVDAVHLAPARQVLVARSCVGWGGRRAGRLAPTPYRLAASRDVPHSRTGSFGTAQIRSTLVAVRIRPYMLLVAPWLD